MKMIFTSNTGKSFNKGEGIDLKVPVRATDANADKK